jgi:hypothetical protein
MAVQLMPRNRHVSEVSHLIELRAEVGENAEQALPPASDTVITVVGAPAALQPQVARDEHHVGVAAREQSIEVVLVEGVTGSVPQLHVLLRHRPQYRGVRRAFRPVSLAAVATTAKLERMVSLSLRGQAARLSEYST